MSVRIFRLPLFPLHHVLFPYAPLSLHIFEERYKAMIRSCLEKDQPFGVMLIREGSEVGKPATPYAIGCTARIVSVKELGEGRLEIFTVGEERFRLIEQREEEVRVPFQEGGGEIGGAVYQSYLAGYVERLEEEALERDALQAASDETLGLFIRYLRCLAAYSDTPLPPVELPNDPVALTFYIAAIMKAPLEVKQKLLSVTNTHARLEMEESLLRRQIAQLEGYAGAEEWTPEEETSIVPETPQLATRMRKEDWRRYFREGRN